MIIWLISFTWSTVWNLEAKDKIKLQEHVLIFFLPPMRFRFLFILYVSEDVGVDFYHEVVSCRGELRTQSNIQDGAFCENS